MILATSAEDNQLSANSSVCKLSIDALVKYPAEAWSPHPKAVSQLVPSAVANCCTNVKSENSDNVAKLSISPDVILAAACAENIGSVSVVIKSAISAAVRKASISAEGENVNIPLE